jgi:hypothetical protein
MRKTLLRFCIAIAACFVGAMTVWAAVMAIPLPDKVKTSDVILIAEVEWTMTNRYFYVFNATNRGIGEFEVTGDGNFVLASDVEDYLDLLRHLKRRRERLELPSTEDGFTPADPLDGEANRFSPEVIAGCKVLEVLKGEDTGKLVRVAFRDPGPPRMIPWPDVLEVGHKYILWLAKTNGLFRMIDPLQGSREVSTNYVDRMELKDNKLHETYITHDAYIDRIRKEVEKQKAQPPPERDK